MNLSAPPCCYAPSFISQVKKGHHPAGVTGGRVALCGVVVETVVCGNDGANAARPLVVRLDDGTGCLDCAYFRADKHELGAALRLGDALQVNGTLNTFRDEIQLRADAVRRVSDANFETLWISRVVYCSTRKENLSGDGP